LFVVTCLSSHYDLYVHFPKACTYTSIHPNAIYAPIYYPKRLSFIQTFSYHFSLPFPPISTTNSIPTRALILIILYLTPINQQKSHIHTPINLPPGKCKLTSPTSAANLLSPPKSFKPRLTEGNFQLLVLYHQRRKRAPAEEPESVVARL
jgi:hypothetical protein